MTVALPLAEMSTEEKLQTLEALWADLCRHADDVPAPAWHGEMLKERERRRAAGGEPDYDWQESQRWLRDMLR